MQAPTYTWESRLLRLAGEAQQSPPNDGLVHAVYDQALLRKAYAYTKALTAHHSRSFYVASGLLPPAKRRAIRALYAFCCVTDDIVDGHQGDQAAVQAALAAWRQRAFAEAPPHDDLVAVAWSQTRTQFPLRYAEQLVEGVARDVDQTRYETFADLATYCYGVASTVGLMSMHIIGFTSPRAVLYAVKLGLALQLTNILRDVGEDWQRGHVYLPQEELRFFDLTETDLRAGKVDQRWRAFMQFQIARTRQLYAEAWPGIALLHNDSRFAIAAAAGIYRAILTDIAAHDYDVFNRRAFVTTWRMFRCLPGLWWSYRTLRIPTYSIPDRRQGG
jgi:phytoene synthase